VLSCLLKIWTIDFIYFLLSDPQIRYILHLTPPTSYTETEEDGSGIFLESWTGSDWVDGPASVCAFFTRPGRRALEIAKMVLSRPRLPAGPSIAQLTQRKTIISFFLRLPASAPPQLPPGSRRRPPPGEAVGSSSAALRSWNLRRLFHRLVSTPLPALLPTPTPLSLPRFDSRVGWISRRAISIQALV
jgi:hypothetical protein